MNTKAFRRWMVMLLAGCSFVPKGTSQTTPDDQAKAWAEEAIRQLVTEIKASPEGKVYLADVDVHQLSFVHRPAIGNQEGWSVQWNHEKEVSHEPNPTTEQRAFADKVHTPTGILLHLYIASAHGNLMVDTTKAFEIKQHPTFVIGYHLVTKDTNEALMKRIEQIIKAEIPPLQKTVPNS